MFFPEAQKQKRLTVTGRQVKKSAALFCFVQGAQEVQLFC